MGSLFVISLEYEAFFPSDLDFPKIHIGSLIDTIIASFVKAFRDLEVFFELPLSFLNLYVEGDIPSRFAIIVSIS